MFMSQCWWVVRVSVWLCCLPVWLRVYPLPTLLHRLTATGGRRPRTHPGEMERVVRLVLRLCHRRCFRGPLFPRACLRQALALYYVLTRMGYPVEMHFGVYKHGETLQGHSWVTIEDLPVAERARTEVFTVVYSYPSASSRFPRDAQKVLSDEDQSV